MSREGLKNRRPRYFLAKSTLPLFAPLKTCRKRPVDGTRKHRALFGEDIGFCFNPCCLVVASSFPCLIQCHFHDVISPHAYCFALVLFILVTICFSILFFFVRFSFLPFYFSILFRSFFHSVFFISFHVSSRFVVSRCRSTITIRPRTPACMRAETLSDTRPWRPRLWSRCVRVLLLDDRRYMCLGHVPSSRGDVKMAWLS